MSGWRPAEKPVERTIVCARCGRGAGADGPLVNVGTRGAGAVYLHATCEAIERARDAYELRKAGR